MDKDDCLTGQCPPMKEEINISRVKLSEGSGGVEMHRLISDVKKNLTLKHNWINTDSDSAAIRIGDKHLFFTSDSYVVMPTFFPGGNIGKIAFCGTVNDLVVSGADPIGISLSLVIEEGFPKDDLNKIIKSINEMSLLTNIPIVTGDTKVMEKRSVDGIVINTSGVGVADKVLDQEILDGDKIIVSGGIGEHGTALLAKRFELETTIESDSKPLVEELKAVRGLIKQAKDVTRGGIASILNEMADKAKKQFIIDDMSVPILKEVRALTEILGIEPYNLACEGRFVCITKIENSNKVLNELKRFNKYAGIIGEVKTGKGVIVQTQYGKKLLNMPSGNIVPRIC